jgi:6-phosphogluconolactonase
VPGPVRELDLGPARVLVFGDREALVRAAAAELRGIVRAAVAARGRCQLALAGGSTPADLYRELAKSGDVPWDRTHLWFGDERHVPPTHPDSNYRMVHETLLGEVHVPAGNVHRIRAELPADEAARAYELELRATFPGPLPRFDLALLGLGEDGHTASLFPASEALDERARLVAAPFVARLDAHRITLLPPVLCAARAVWFVAVGERKAAIARDVLRGPLDGERLPAQLVRPSDGALVWWLDGEAAALL